jgi:hypothetical protein
VGTLFTGQRKRERDKERERGRRRKIMRERKRERVLQSCSKYAQAESAGALQGDYLYTYWAEFQF